MIEFHCNRRDKYGNPIVYNTDIWEYAESLVGDYKPSLLEKPGAINPVHFVEAYLGATVDYQNIYFEEHESPIAGATVFNDDFVKVFDRERMCTRAIPVSANTILIDIPTMEEMREGYQNFTVLHEGGHFTMHGEVYRRDPFQMSFLPERISPSVVQCRRSTVCTTPKDCRNWTPEQRREHQANVFAAFVAMPRKTFVPFAQDMIRRAGFSEGIYVEESEWDWCSDEPLYNISRTLSETYGVSRSAALIHLRTLNLLKNYREAQFAAAQAAIAF